MRANRGNRATTSITRYSCICIFFNAIVYAIRGTGEPAKFHARFLACFGQFRSRSLPKTNAKPRRYEWAEWARNPRQRSALHSFADGRARANRPAQRPRYAELHSGNGAARSRPSRQGIIFTGSLTSATPIRRRDVPVARRSPVPAAPSVRRAANSATAGSDRRSKPEWGLTAPRSAIARPARVRGSAWAPSLLRPARAPEAPNP